MGDDFFLRFLGTGTSVGVPVIGCDCAVCTSTDPRNNRTRSSVHLHAGEIDLLVDSGPDLREQALRENMRRLDAVLYTHGHVDHVTGFDELRAFCWARETPLPVHGNKETLEILESMYPWAFSSENVYKGYVKPKPVPIDGPFYYGDVHITALPVIHGSVETNGYLFDTPGYPPIAYIPDVKDIPDDTLKLIAHVDILIIDSLRPSAHPTHMSLAEALAMIEKVNADQAWLTHLGHENDHQKLSASLPANIHVAYDGLRIPGF